jgi:hypothetical protein
VGFRQPAQAARASQDQMEPHRLKSVQRLLCCGLQEKEAMLPCPYFNVAVELIEKLRSFRGEKCEQSEGPFLQGIVGKQRIGNLILMRIQDSRAKTFGPAGFRAQAGKLIQHFLGCVVERTQQCLIQFGERFAQPIYECFDCSLAIIKMLRERLR